MKEQIKKINEAKQLLQKQNEEILHFQKMIFKLYEKLNQRRDVYRSNYYSSKDKEQSIIWLNQWQGLQESLDILNSIIENEKETN